MPTIKKFNTSFIQMCGEIRVADLKSLSERLPNLTELGFVPDRELTKNDLIDLFQLYPELEKIFLNVRYEIFARESFDFQNDISEEFHVCDYRNDAGFGVITIERKPLNSI